MTTVIDPQVRAEAEEAMLQSRQGSSTRVLLGVCGAGAVVVAMAASHTPAWMLAAWYGVMLLSQAARMYVEVYACRADKGHSLPQRMAWSSWAAGASGLVQAASLLFFAQKEGQEQALHTVILLVMSTGAVIYTAGHPRIYYPYMTPIIGALALAWWTVSVAADQQQWLAIGFGVLILAYGANLLSYAQATWSMWLNAAAMRHQEALQNRRLAAAVQEAQAASQAKTRFLAAASHDLRQPIHSIALLAGVLKLRHGQGTSADVVALLDSVVQSLSHQLDDLLDISKLDAGVVEVAPQPLALRRFLRRRLDEVAHDAQAKGLDLALDAPADATVFTDPHLFERVMRNLLGNAVKFTSQGRVCVTLATHGTHAVVRVHDTGCGIAPEHQQEVFHEFVQLNNPARDRTQGMGLGLSIVERLCKLLGVTLTLQSFPGRGSTFELRLPLAATASPQVPGAGPAAAPSTTGMRVLVVDDEAMVRQAMAWLLAELGCTCVTAHDRSSAVEAVQEQRPDLALVDFRLREGDHGLAVVDALRERHPGLPALIVSGDIGPQQLQTVDAAGLRLLHKPVSAQVLKAELHALRPGAPHAPT